MLNVIYNLHINLKTEFKKCDSDKYFTLLPFCGKRSKVKRHKQTMFSMACPV